MLKRFFYENINEKINNQYDLTIAILLVVQLIITKNYRLLKNIFDIYCLDFNVSMTIIAYWRY